MMTPERAQAYLDNIRWQDGTNGIFMSDLLTAYLASVEENERLRESLGDIARQRTTSEMPEAERYDADVETGYIECIMRARQALKPKEPKP